MARVVKYRMLLSSHHAQKIVEDMYHIANYNLIFTDEQGIIIASVEKSRIGDLHEGALEVLRTKDKVVIRHSKQFKGTKQGIAYPIALNKKVVGVIGITGTEEEVGKLGEIIKRVVEMLVRERYMEKQMELENVARESFVQEWLLHRHDDEQAFISRGYFLGIDVTLPRIVCVVEMRKDRMDKEQEKQSAHNEELFMQKIKTSMMKKVKEMLPYPEHDLIAPISRSRYVILFTLPAVMNDIEVKSYVEEPISSLKEWLEKEFGRCIAVGIGGSYEGMNGIKQSYMEAEKSVYFSGKREQSPITFYQDLRFERFIYDLSSETRQEYIKGILKLDLLPDPSQTLEILDCLFKCNHSINEVANRLHIHKNTVQYRLNKIKELTGFDPRNFEDAAALYLAVFLHSLEMQESQP
ncbi:CdaR family transcriptional regulator [Microbacteriaceae bacterium 4G12]